MNNYAKLTTCFALAALIFSGCKKDDEFTREQLIDNLFAQGSEVFEEVPDSRKTDTLNIEEPMTEDRVQDNEGEDQTVRWVCTRKRLSITDGNSEFPLFNTNADVIYPGNLFQGKSLSNATPAPIVVKRSGGTISYDLNNGNLSSAFTVDEVKKSTIQNAMNNIISGAGDVLPANFELNIIRIQSREQLALEMGLKIETWTAKASANMSFSSEYEYNRFLVKLRQVYYTMSFDLPTSKDELFHPDVTPEQLNQYVGPDNPATFISSVTYGRIFYMLVESTSSEQDMQAALNVSYSSFGNSAGGEVEVESFKSLSNLKIKVIAYGGDAKGVFQIAGETSVEEVANRLAESTQIESGLPLSYVVRSVDRPDMIVGTNISTEFDVVDCELRGILPPPGYQSLVDLFKSNNDEGGIGAMAQLTDNALVVYNKAGTRYAIYSSSTTRVSEIFDIHDPNGPMGATSFASIGAAVDYNNSTEKDIYIFDGDGLHCEIFEFSSVGLDLSTTPTRPIGQYRQADGANRVYSVNDIFGDSGNFGLANRGIGAVNRNGASTMTYFSVAGDQWQMYNSSGAGTWIDTLQSNEMLYPVGGTVFEKVGAASHINFGGSSGRWLYVNKNGDELMERHPAPNRKYEGPWVIN